MTENKLIQRKPAPERDEYVCRMRSGHLVLADMQYLRGYSILIGEPHAPSINDVSPEQQALFMQDMAVVGDLLMRVTGAYRVNYAILGNTDPYLHAHIVPRYTDEPAEYIHGLPWSYPNITTAETSFSLERHSDLIQKLRDGMRKWFPHAIYQM